MSDRISEPLWGASRIRTKPGSSSAATAAVWVAHRSAGADGRKTIEHEADPEPSNKN
jgi:hypothetical protein